VTADRPSFEERRRARQPEAKKPSRFWWLWLGPLALVLALLLMHNWLVVAALAGTALFVGAFAWSWPSERAPGQAGDLPETRPLRPEEAPARPDEEPE